MREGNRQQATPFGEQEKWMLRLHIPGFTWHSFVWIGLAKETLSKRRCSGIKYCHCPGSPGLHAAGPEIILSIFKLEPQGGAKPQLANLNLKPLNSFSRFVNLAQISPTFMFHQAPLIRTGLFVLLVPLVGLSSSIDCQLPGAWATSWCLLS